MPDLRPIDCINVSDLEPARPGTGEPIFERADPRSLYVDPSYQRSVSERGMRQIRRIVERFCWTNYKPPICAYAEDEQGQTILKVLDGQHTAIAAASNPHIDMIPVMIVEAPETAAQAAAFVGQNTERVGVTPLQVHRAAVVACDEDALTIKNVCERAGVRILSSTPGTARFKPGDTVAVTTIRGLVHRRTAMTARKVLEVLANADLAPITTHHIRAAEHLMTDKDHRTKFEPADLSHAIGELFLVAEDEAKIMSHAHRMPFWKALAAVWFRKTKKRRVCLRAVA